MAKTREAFCYRAYKRSRKALIKTSIKRDGNFLNVKNVDKNISPKLFNFLPKI